MPPAGAGAGLSPGNRTMCRGCFLSMALTVTDQAWVMAEDGVKGAGASGQLLAGDRPARASLRDRTGMGRTHDEPED